MCVSQGPFTFLQPNLTGPDKVDEEVCMLANICIDMSRENLEFTIKDTR